MGLNPDVSNRGTQLFIVLMSVLSLAWVLVLLRAYVRGAIVKNVAADDWWMFASMLAYTGYSTVAMWGVVDGGSGQHFADITLEQTLNGLEAWYVCEVLYAPISAMVRTSVALFLLRVATEPIHRWAVYINLGIIYIITMVFTFVVAFQCNPPSYFYEQVLGKPGSCIGIEIVPNVTIAHSAIGAMCDLVFASLPVAMLWNVQLNLRTKLVIALLLSMGFVAGVALLVRIPFVKVLAISKDFLFETTDVAIWSIIEPSLGIIAGCAATLRPLFKGLGFGRQTTQRYAYGSDSGPFPRSIGASNRSLGMSRLTTQKLDDTPTIPNTMYSPLVGSGASPGMKSDSHVVLDHNTDIEMQQGPLLVRPPGKGHVSTNIASVPWNDEHESQERGGISVHTSINVTSQPRPLTSSSARSPRWYDRGHKGVEGRVFNV